MKLTLMTTSCLLIFTLTLQAATNSCDLALNACKTLVSVEDIQVTHLKQQVKQLEQKLNQEADPIIPWWGWVVIGGVVGGLAIHEVQK